ncbi:alpha/beta fold hydrolase [Streptosporangiaceae bacterium NEAU-GS5]|nr:alpha/beta fold hydrolase [Streptosporangiaceae bacterium NEAU-GS5]
MEFDGVSPGALDEVEVPGGRLRIARFGSGPRLIVAVHGITASLMSWRAIGEALPPEWTLVAMDLRGRGHSAGVPGPYGLDAHAADVERVAEHVGAGETAVLAGHSMGAYVAALHAPDRAYERVVLIDGGLPMPLPPDVDVDAVLEAGLGPAIARLDQTFADVTAYVDFFKAHPALTEWAPAIEDYVRYDAVETPDGVRSRVRADAVRVDGRWLLTGSAAVGDALKRTTAPIRLIRAPRGLLNQPVGMIPNDVAAAWTAQLPTLEDELLDDCNHYTMVFDPRCVRRVVERLTVA